MAGIAGVGAAAAAAGPGGNPLSGLGASQGLSAGSLSGMADMGLGTGGASDGTDQGAPGSGIAPTQAATPTQGASFGNALKTMLVENPSRSKAYAGELTTRFAAGDTSIDPHQISIASAKAGVEIQMATRTISSAVSAVRTLFQMQV